MPSSPLDPSETEAANDPESAFRKGLVEIDELIDRGVSLSGHEPNCAFLNIPVGPGEDPQSNALGGRRFATASEVLGIGFDDDGRALVPVDWDGDGDLDVWAANRTAPMLRFLRNDLPASKNWAAFRLEGKRCNRDAIGARLILELDDGRRLTRTLKAGEGYLAQSSKWLHFGTGGAGAIASLTVRWPGGETERIDGVESGARFHVVQGSGRAKKSPGRKVATTGERTRAAVGAATVDEGHGDAVGGAVRAWSVSRWPLPLLPYTTFRGEPANAGGKSSSGSPVLVNLWATWCIPCVAELGDWRDAYPDFRRAGVEVFALSVDGLGIGNAVGGSEGGGNAAPGGDPAAFFREHALPFRGGRATAELVRRLEVAYAHLFGPRWPLPVPTSVLIDGDGQLAAIYRGAVSAERVLADVGRMKQDRVTLHDDALPFPGRWFRRPSPVDPLPLALDLMEHGQVDASWELAARAKSRYQVESPEYGKLLTWVGDELMKAGRARDALDAYTAALEEDDENMLVLNNVAWQLAAHPDPAVRDGKNAVKWAEKAAALTGHRDPAVLDTLAAAYAEAGDFKKAVATAEKALGLARAQNNRALEDGIQNGLRNYRVGRAFGRE